MKLKHFWHSYVTSGLELTVSNANYRRVYLINTLMLIGLIVFGFFTLFNLTVTHLYAVMGIDIAGFFLSLFTIMLLRKWHNIELSATLLILIIFFSTLSFIFLEAHNNYAFFYMIFLPIFAIFLKGMRIGLLYSGIYYGFILTFILLYRKNWDSAPFTQVSLINIVATIIAFTLLIRYYEKSRSEAFDAMKQSENTAKEHLLLLKETNEELELQREHLKAANNELFEYQNNLESKVEEAIYQKRAQEQMMIQQSKMAAMGEMIGAIAHQWKQPLSITSVIVNNIKMDLALKDDTSQPVQKDLDKILEQVQFMSQTIRDFASFFKPKKNQEHFDLSAAIDDITKIYASQLEKHQITLLKKFPSEPIEITGYKNEFLQVLLNIINNAKDAIAEIQTHNPQIVIQAKKEADKVIFSITDNGGGIKDDVIERLFEPYFTTKSDTAGTGIGLYMSKIIIEDHMHGTIDVKNAEKGAQFIITL